MDKKQYIRFCIHMAKEKAKNLRLCIEIKPSCSLHSLQCRSTLAMRGRHVQVSIGVRRTCRASFLFWWGQMSFFCIEPLRLAIKTKNIHSVLILFLESAKFTEKWNPVFILILASSTHFYSACISTYMKIFFFFILVQSGIQIKSMFRILFKNSCTEVYIQKFIPVWASVLYCHRH